MTTIQKKIIRKVAVAYSGGLDTSIILKWLRLHYGCQVVAVCVNVGQKDNFSQVKKKALATGASEVFVIDARREFVTDYIWPALKTGAVYEGKYLLATALARPLIAEKLVQVALKVGADSVAHGATGKGNDQVRFELTFAALAPDLHIIAPWREWDIQSRQDAVQFARKHGIPVPVTPSKPYSSDENLWHISYEGGILEDPDVPPSEDMFLWTVSPQKAPSRGEEVLLSFKEGVPVGLNGKRMDPVSLIERLNIIAGRQGVGRVDLVENRLVGIKSRGVYECPAATVLYQAHHELESIILDRETLHAKEEMSLRYGILLLRKPWMLLSTQPKEMSQAKCGFFCTKGMLLSKEDLLPILFIRKIMPLLRKIKCTIRQMQPGLYEYSVFLTVFLP